MDAREPKEIEDPRMAIFVKGTHTGEVVNGVMKELVRTSTPLQSYTHIEYFIFLADGTQTPQRYLLLQEKHHPPI